MEAKLRQLMKHEGINSTRLADILGIQASGISHIMSGRNKPSFDFLLKLLQRFPQINPDWLLLDKGPMYRDEVKGKAAQSARAVATPTLGSEGGLNLGFPTVGEGAGVPRVAVGEGSGISRGTGGVSALGGGLIQGGVGTLGSGLQVGGVGASASGILRGEVGGGARDGGFLSRGDGAAGNIATQGDAMYAKAAGAAGGRGVGGSTGRVQGLFGPDNDDIIPSGEAYGDPAAGGGHVARGGYTGYRGDRGELVERVGHGDRREPVERGDYGERGERGDQGEQGYRAVGGGHTQAGNPVPRGVTRDISSDAQRLVGQSGMFVPSTDIERIVVFYRDKTFSEYRPE